MMNERRERWRTKILEGSLDPFSAFAFIFLPRSSSNRPIARRRNSSVLSSLCQGFIPNVVDNGDIHPANHSVTTARSYHAEWDQTGGRKGENEMRTMTSIIVLFSKSEGTFTPLAWALRICEDSMPDTITVKELIHTVSNIPDARGCPS